MKDTTKQVIILDNFSSPDIQQAIIILKKTASENETKIILEAEDIIRRYLDRRPRSRVKSDKKALSALCVTLIIGALITTLAIVGAVYLFKNIL